MGVYGFFGLGSKGKKEPDSGGSGVDPGAVKGALDYYTSPGKQKANLIARIEALKQTQAMLGNSGRYLGPLIAGLEAKLAAIETAVEEEKIATTQKQGLLTASRLLLGAGALALTAVAYSTLRSTR